MTVSSKTFNLAVGESVTPFTTIQIDSFSQAPFVGCFIFPEYDSITHSNFVDTVNDGSLQPIVSQANTSFTCQTTSPSSCGDLNLNQNGYEFSIDFVIKFNVGGKTGLIAEQFDSQLMTINMVCQPGHEIFPSITYTEEWQEENWLENNTFSFSHFYCQYPDCCQFSVADYQLEILSNPLRDPTITCCQSTTDANGVETLSYHVDVNKQFGAVEFRLKVETALGDIGYTLPITMNIAEECPADLEIRSPIRFVEVYMAEGESQNNTVRFGPFSCAKS